MSTCTKRWQSPASFIVGYLLFQWMKQFSVKLLLFTPCTKLHVSPTAAQLDGKPSTAPKSRVRGIPCVHKPTDPGLGAFPVCTNPGLGHSLCAQPHKPRAGGFPLCTAPQTSSSGTGISLVELREAEAWQPSPA